MQLSLIRRIVKAARIALPVLALSSLPAPAQAHGFALGPSWLFLLGSGSQCLIFTYDANGNRIAQTVGTVGSSGTVWGSGTYGCFIWSQ